MEKPIFPSEYMRITQGYSEGTHKDSFAIDNAGKDSGISDIYAPFTGIIKKIYQTDANEVWLESSDKVEYPDGTIDYMTVMFAHSNDVSNLFVGKRINQKEVFYSEGTKGNVTGNHCHFECSKGKFTGSGWHKNNSGYWSINNGIEPEKCLWIDDTIKILDNHNYNFKTISTDTVEKTNNEETPKVEKTKNTKSFTAKKADLYGVYLKENQKVTIEY
jgi:hypothetical protein